MPKFKITRHMRYTETLTIEADSQDEAENMSLDSDAFEINHDDTEIDRTIREVE